MRGSIAGPRKRGKKEKEMDKGPEASPAPTTSRDESIQQGWAHPSLAQGPSASYVSCAAPVAWLASPDVVLPLLAEVVATRRYYQNLAGLAYSYSARGSETSSAGIELLIIHAPHGVLLNPVPNHRPNLRGSVLETEN